MFFTIIISSTHYFIELLLFQKTDENFSETPLSKIKAELSTFLLFASIPPWAYFHYGLTSFIFLSLSSDSKS